MRRSGISLWNRNDIPVSAQKAKQVYGVEIIPQAIEDDRKNAQINGIENAKFYKLEKQKRFCRDIMRIMPRHIRDYRPTLT